MATSALPFSRSTLRSVQLPIRRLSSSRQMVKDQADCPCWESTFCAKCSAPSGPIGPLRPRKWPVSASLTASTSSMKSALVDARSQTRSPRSIGREVAVAVSSGMAR